MVSFTDLKWSRSRTASAKGALCRAANRSIEETLARAFRRLKRPVSSSVSIWLLRRKWRRWCERSSLAITPASALRSRIPSGRKACGSVSALATRRGSLEVLWS
jgi:hypothetical protein